MNSGFNVEKPRLSASPIEMAYQTVEASLAQVEESLALLTERLILVRVPDTSDAKVAGHVETKPRTGSAFACNLLSLSDRLTKLNLRLTCLLKELEL